MSEVYKRPDVPPKRTPPSASLMSRYINHTDCTNDKNPQAHVKCTGLTLERRVEVEPQERTHQICMHGATAGSDVLSAPKHMA